MFDLRFEALTAWLAFSIRESEVRIDTGSIRPSSISDSQTSPRWHLAEVEEVHTSFALQDQRFTSFTSFEFVCFVAEMAEMAEMIDLAFCSSTR